MAWRRAASALASATRLRPPLLPLLPLLPPPRRTLLLLVARRSNDDGGSGSGGGERRWSWRVLALAGVAAGAAVVALRRGRVEAADDAEDEAEATVKEGKGKPPAEGKSSPGFRNTKIINYENRIRKWSNPERVFRYFATKELDGQPYMTPQDFVRAVLPGEMQPESLRMDAFERVDAASYERSLAASEALWRSGDFFRNQPNMPLGLLSYADYVFLVTAMTTPTRRFRIAFQMFDLDGNGTVDMQEFQQVQSAVQSTMRKGSRPTSSRRSVPTRSVLMRHFFGPKGAQRLTYERYDAFVHRLQDDLLHEEFNRACSADGTMSELAFCELLLAYANMKDGAEYLDRAKRRQDQAAITFEEFRTFNELLRSIDDVDLALGMYSAVGASITKSDLKRCAHVVALCDLSDHTIDVVFNLFDKDGDQRLSHREFVSIMKDRAKRGLDQPRTVGGWKGMKGLIQCVKLKMRAADS